MTLEEFELLYGPKPVRKPTKKQIKAAEKAMADIEEMFGGKK